jgi:flagellar hook-length control protein FliK
MTPMMLPSSAAAATPGGLMKAGDPLAATSVGSPVTPGAPGTGDETPFAGFDVALLAVLDAASLADGEGQGGAATASLAGTDTAASELPIAVTWRYSTVPVYEDDEPVALPVEGSNTNAALAGAAAAEASIVAALAGAPIPASESTRRAISPELSGDDDVSDDGLSSSAPMAARVTEQRSGPDSHDFESGANQLTPGADAKGATGPGQEAATGVSPDSRSEAPPALAARPEIGADAQPESGTPHAAALREAARLGHAELKQHPPAPTAPWQAVNMQPTPPVQALNLRAWSDPTQTTGTATRSEQSASGDSDRTAAAVALTDASAGSLQAAPDPTASLGGGRERDSEHDTRQTVLDTWLRRSSSIESRLAPPATFVMSLHRLTTPATTSGSEVRVPFEMPAPTENLSRLVQSLRVQARDGVSEATVRLNPEHLGEVTIAVRIERGTVTAVVRAESGDVRQWLRGQEDSIRAALAHEGMHLDELVVEQDARRRGDQEQEAHQQGRRNRARGQRMATASFEITA